MLRSGTFVGDRYEIISRIGSGGMSDVYKANDHKLNRMVAIKVLKREFCDNHNFVSRFKVEAQAAAKLTQPNIVAIYDVGDEADLHYIVMELVEGITLKDYISRKGRLENRETIGITIQVAQGLEAAHSQSIVHRDVKPQNIIISREGKVKVMDFGIAKAVTGNTINSEAMGSVHYISPEQARGGYCDARSDIYSLGITMYEMLTGVVPYDGDNTISVALAHIQGGMTSPRELVPTITTSLEKIILKCTQRAPERRYASAGELILDLRKSLVMPEGDFVVVPAAAPGNGGESSQETPGQEDILIPGAVSNANPLPAGEEPDYDEDTLYRESQDDEEFDPVEDDDYFGDVEPDQEPEESPSVSDRVMLVASVVLGVIILIMAVYLIGRMTGLIKPRGKQPNQDASTSETETLPEGKTRMPDLINMTEEEAKAALKEAGLGMDVEYDSSETIAKDHVMKQEYEENEIIDKNIKVLVTISTGSSMTEIPSSLIGMTKAEAEAALAKLDLNEKGITVVYTDQSSETYAEGLICGMAPSTGLVQENGTLILYVSVGKAVVAVKMPSVVNQTVDTAKTYLENMGLVVSVVEVTDSSVPAGYVTSQSIAAETQVMPGTAVTLTVSTGPVKMPNLIGLEKNDALNALQAAGITNYTITETPVNSASQIGRVLEQSVAYNTDYTGETVNITVGVEASSVVLPANLVPGISGEAAVNIINELNMGLSTHTSEDFSDEYPAGSVIRVTPGAGETVSRGQSIEIVVSKGPKPTTSTESESEPPVQGSEEQTEGQ